MHHGTHEVTPRLPDADIFIGSLLDTHDLSLPAAVWKSNTKWKKKLCRRRCSVAFDGLSNFSLYIMFVQIKFVFCFLFHALLTVGVITPSVVKRRRPGLEIIKFYSSQVYVHILSFPILLSEYKWRSNEKHLSYRYEVVAFNSHVATILLKCGNCTCDEVRCLSLPGLTR